MYLQGGMWQGKPVLPEAWVAEATYAHSDNSNTQTNPDWSVGYGYQFWRCRHDAYRGDGAFGQFCVVMPQQDAVLTINSGLRDMQVVLDKVWAHLLPAMQPATLPVDPEAHAELCARLSTLALPLPAGQAVAPGTAQWSGKTYKLETNDLRLASVALEFGAASNTLRVRDEQGEHTLEIGHGTWSRGTTSLRGRGTEPSAAAGAWTAADTYEVRYCYTAAEVCPLLRFHFKGDELLLEVEPNVSWGSTTVTTLYGHV